jgi:hypothetical protein
MDRQRWLQILFGVAAATLFLVYVAMALWGPWG